MDDFPRFVPPMSKEISGDDPLGMAPVNERLYGNVFPGINNVVQYIRVYSAICWTLESIDEYLNSNKLTVAQAKKIYKNGLQKIQVLITWSNMDLDVPGMAGSTRKFPTENRKIPLLFESFGDSTVSYLDAVQYRPSLTSGLDFAESREHNMIGCLPAGKHLAKAFLNAACEDPNFDWMADVTDLEATPKKVKSLASILNLKAPSVGECNAFLDQYFPSEKPDDIESSKFHRWAGLTLALRAIDSCNKEEVDADESQIRMTMARGSTVNRSIIDTSGIEQEQQWWAVLQLRQLEKLIFDTMESIFERWLDFCIQQSPPKNRGIHSVCSDFEALLSDALENEAKFPLSFHLTKISKAQGNFSSLYHAGIKKKTVDIFRIMDELRSSHLEIEYDGTFSVLIPLFNALLVCVVETRNLIVNPLAKEAICDGSGHGSLSDLVASAEEFSEKSAGDWISHLMNYWVINRHFEVVTIRSQNADGKNRFRFVIGENGLQRYDMSLKPSAVSFAQDRLRHALLLLNQSGLIRLKDGGYFLTKKGERRL